MKKRFMVIMLLAVSMLAFAGWAQTQRSVPSTADEVVPADELLRDMLRQDDSRGQSLPPITEPAPDDRTTGEGAVAPGAVTMTVMREGTFLVDRTGRLTRNSEGQMEFTFEADGRAMGDPPVILLPNLTLEAMEHAVTRSSRDLRFRITGEVTEYRGRNYVLLHKAVVVPDVEQQF